MDSKYTQADAFIWSMFYSGLASIERHPRNEAPRSFKEIAAEADLMFLEYQRRFACPG